MQGVIESQIRKKLVDRWSPDWLEVLNESSSHHVPPGSETHFKVILVSAHLRDLSRLKRHQACYELLSQELQADVHALSLHLFTPEEWDQTKDRERLSPRCRGGSQK